MKRTQTQPKDVLLNITGASIGRCAYIPENFKEGNVNQHVCIIRTIPKYINYKYLTYLLNSPEIQSLIKRINSGATREALNLTQIRNIDIPICNIQEQEQIVFHLDSKFTLIKNLEDSINKELLNLEKLKHSILNEAFNGKLVPQNENEESAFNLLNQIKTEKALYLKKNKSEKMKTSSENKNSIKKKTLLELLKEEYSDTEFSFEDIRNLSNMSYEDLKTELYLLLDKNKELEIVFNKSVKKILYKIKS
jgi:type I restriction enzyme S subunit